MRLMVDERDKLGILFPASAPGSVGELLARGLAVMDATAFEMCRQNGMKMRIFGMDDLENIIRVACGADLGTRVDV